MIQNYPQDCNTTLFSFSFENTKAKVTSLVKNQIYDSNNIRIEFDIKNERWLAIDNQKRKLVAGRLKNDHFEIVEVYHIYDE